MFDVYLMNFQKNVNSTAQPNITGLTPTSVKLKSPCSVLQPVIELSWQPSSQATLAQVNYVYIPDFSRYYFVVKTVFNGTLADIYLKVDALASWKTAITGTSQYVLRSASNWNGAIKDTQYPLKAVLPDHSGVYGTQNPNPFQPSGNNTLGSFVVGVIQKGCPFGTVSYYVMSQLVFLDFMLKLFNLPTHWGNDGSDLADGLKKAITDPMQYVVSAYWYPYSVNDFVSWGLVTATTSVTVGYDTFSLGASAYSFNTAVNLEHTDVESFTIPEHPQAASRGSYMNFEPFSRYYLSFYPFAPLVELDSTQVGGAGTIYAVYTIDFRSGRGICSICTQYNGSPITPKSPIRVFEAQVGVSLPVATIHTELQSLSEYGTNAAIAAVNEFGGFQQTEKKLVNTLSNKVMGALASLTGSEDLRNAVEDAETRMDTISLGDLSKIATNAAAMKSTCEMFGTQGTISMFYRMPVAAWGNFYYAADDNAVIFGRPLCAVASLATLSGFTQCATPRIFASGMHLEEQIEIQNKMAEGFFLA